MKIKRFVQKTAAIVAFVSVSGMWAMWRDLTPEERAERIAAWQTRGARQDVGLWTRDLEDFQRDVLGLTEEQIARRERIREGRPVRTLRAFRRDVMGLPVVPVVAPAVEDVDGAPSPWDVRYARVQAGLPIRHIGAFERDVLDLSDEELARRQALRQMRLDRIRRDQWVRPIGDFRREIIGIDQ